MTASSRWRLFLTGIVLWVSLVAGSVHGAGRPDSGIWVRVDTVAEIVELWRGDERLRTFPDIALGRGGVSDLHLNGDQTTPRGTYRVTHFNDDSRFHRFIGLNYPTLDHLGQAYRVGALSIDTYRITLDAGLASGRFPQDGPLGGHIGLHGIGDGDPAVHRAFHWTEGCVALTNEQIEALRRRVQIGTPVVIE